VLADKMLIRPLERIDAGPKARSEAEELADR